VKISAYQDPDSREVFLTVTLDQSELERLGEGFFLEERHEGHTIQVRRRKLEGED